MAVHYSLFLETAVKHIHTVYFAPLKQNEDRISANANLLFLFLCGHGSPRAFSGYLLNVVVLVDTQRRIGRL